MPAVAVNRDGVVGVSWLDGRNSPSHRGYDAYLSASVDGGRTFLPPVRLSSVTSIPARAGNAFPAVVERRPLPTGERQVGLISPFNQRPGGADNASIAVDADGRFHPVWADARHGAWQLYTSTIRVLHPSAAARLEHLRTWRCDADMKQVSLVYGAASWDSVTFQAQLPIRVLNGGADTLVHPIRVEVAAAAPVWTNRGLDGTAFVPRVLDPQTGAPTDSAVAAYPASVDQPLFPGAVSPEVVWRFRVARPELMDFGLRVKISGVCPAGSRGIPR
jgi:hypothetical protein